nr:uncharacterized protein LOC113815961 isoform X1 [Penaeus vannamei]
MVTTQFLSCRERNKTMDKVSKKNIWANKISLAISSAKETQNKTPEVKTPEVKTPKVKSVTNVCNTRYALERRLFQQLLELKRVQIKNTRANEQVLIKRMVDAYMKEGVQLGIRGYNGPYNFQSYEKYLYDQLRYLQSSQSNKIPAFKPTDDVERLSRALRRQEILELPDPLMTPRDPHTCNHTTHRCHHAAHAYTGVPCAAYLGHRGKKKNQLSLPKIAGSTNANGGSSSLGASPGPASGGSLGRNRPGEPIGLRNYDPKRPLTVELQHGNTRQQITLPTEILDKNKKYHLTFTIKPSAPGQDGLSPSKDGSASPKRSASAPEGIVPDEAVQAEPRPELRSAPAEGRTEASVND